MSSAVLVKRTGEPSDIEYYVYHSSGIRVRKVCQRYIKSGGESFKFLDIEEKIYLDGYEIKRNKRINLEDNPSKEITILERYSCHIMDDKKRIAIIHRWNIDKSSRETDDINEVRIHYQLSNTLDSCSLEIDVDQQIISYEEYYPFGGTSFIAGNSSSSSLNREVSIKDYRYTGKERDDSTGLLYHLARYYAPWIGRWINCDPIGTKGGIDLYEYSFDNPINNIDITGKQPGPESLKANQDRFNEIYNQTGDNVAQTLIQSFTAGGFNEAGTGAAERLKTILDLTRSSGLKHFNQVAAKGDTGFRREFRDSVKYYPNAKGKDEELWRGSRHQIGHFLTAVDAGYQVGEQEVIARIGNNKDTWRIVKAFENMTVKALIGHELIPDNSSFIGNVKELSKPSAEVLQAVLSIHMANSEQVVNFLDDKLDKIAINSGPGHEGDIYPRFVPYPSRLRIW